MNNPLARIRGLGAYTVEELCDRAHELWEHSRMLSLSPGYYEAYLRGEVPDPMQGYQREDPWYSLSAIEEHLNGRMNR